MENKLDSLTQKIYQEGIEKANQERDDILNNAKTEADRIIKDAKKEADQIKTKAQDEAEELKRNSMADLKLAGNQAISSLKQQIKDLLVVKILKDPTKEIFVDTNFLKELILSITKNWDHKEGITLSFSPKMQEKIDKAFENSIKKEVKDLNITYDKRLTEGFRITPKNGSFQITFTDQDFVEFFKPFVRDKSEKILFQKES